MATGAKSRLLVGFESDWATAAMLKYLLPFTSESLNHNIEGIKSEAILGKRGTAAVAPGKESAEGSVDMEVYPSFAGMAFYWALGKATLIDPDDTPSSGDEYTVIEPISIDEELPSASIRVEHGGISSPFAKKDFIGVKVDSLEFSGGVGGIPSISLSLVGKEELNSPSLIEDPDLVQPDAFPFYFKEMFLSKDGTNYDVTTYSEIRLTINNNLDKDEYVLDGTGKRVALPAGALEITGSATLILDDTTLMDEYLKYRAWQDFSLWIKLAQGSQEFVIQLPRVHITKATHDIGGKDRLTLSIEFECLEDSTNGLIKIEDHFNANGTY